MITIGSKVVVIATREQLDEIFVDDDLAGCTGVVDGVFPDGWYSVVFEMSFPMMDNTLTVDYDIPFKYIMRTE